MGTSVVGRARIKKTTIFCSLAASLWVSGAGAVDFKIDLPPQRGVSAPDDEYFFDDVLSVTESQSDVLEQVSGNTQNALPDPNPPSDDRPSAIYGRAQAVPRSDSPDNSQAEKNQLKSKKTAGMSAVQQEPTFGLPQKQSQRMSIDTFPNPLCLNENVSFWKRVYAEVDVNEALIHDRDDLDKVYAVVRLGGNGVLRQQSTQMLKDHYRYALVSLAEKLDSPRSWSSNEKAIAKLFRPSELSRSRLLQAAENIRVQQGLKSRFDAGVRRSLQYLPTIKPILRQQNLPLEIAFLPHVESSFVNHARSKVGAVGLWQLMPKTMQLLMGKKAVGRRTDPAIATEAAAKLLKQNFQATGSWPLALTAYNHGLGGVLRAVRHTSSSDLCQIIERYNSRSFKFASSNFYAQFLAARQIALQRYSELSKNKEVNRIVAPLIARREKGAL
ncbi:MAG: lytic transglycosylase domain-containing protein [Proteobacteria bacterium]|nr:lytic transglycosylase domain-containing protein [Pseudomonadota bacterium]